MKKEGEGFRLRFLLAEFENECSIEYPRKLELTLNSLLFQRRDLWPLRLWRVSVFLASPDRIMVKELYKNCEHRNCISGFLGM